MAEPRTPARKASHKGAVHAASAERAPASEQPGQPERGTRAWPFFVAFGVILLLIVGTVWFTNFRGERQQVGDQYNGFDFSMAQGGIWVTRIEVGAQPYDVPFYFHPRDTESVIVEPNATLVVARRPRELYISLDPDAGATPVVAAVEISRLTGSKYNLYNIETHGALSRMPEERVDLPVMDCRNATPERAVIQFIQGSRNAILVAQNPNCVILQYTSANESIRVADRYGYMLLRIM